MSELLEFFYRDASDNNALSWAYFCIYLLHLLVYHFD